MRAAASVFETWYSANFVHEKGDEDIKKFFREAFEAGMVSGLAFIQQSVQDDVELLMQDYKGFQDE